MTAYQQAQQAGQQAVRAAILDAATHLLVTEGARALTVRGISGAVGCSTKVIYTLFGGKEGLAQALWLEGFARFERRLLAAGGDPDPLVRLMECGIAYRAYALDEPDYYRVMFQGALPGFVPSPEALAAARRAFDILTAHVSACLEAGRLRGGTAEEIADLLWMAVHGATSLELAGHLTKEQAERRYRLLCVSMLSAFLTSDERTAP
ncbi:TetR/AcrR family transcriptional regulator [Nonomuraea africana]|uniref:AcrR family transcriptional regulator n=1 Tax=Nonomuraea africana TaxID=46171 RepID=A0ABR9KGX5_9ACTN|nr:TetR/AcrR family transcriptional regulator [Nonomuraea africana]MBE1561278.1 AcrR family transcriptional regulator [Nonomuraea africana]